MGKFDVFDTSALTGSHSIWRFDCIMYVSNIVGTEFTEEISLTCGRIH